MDNNDLSYKSAQEFAKDLGDLSQAEQYTILTSPNYSDFRRISETQAQKLWEGRIAYRQQAASGVHIEILPPREKNENQNAGRSALADQGAGLLAGTSVAMVGSFLDRDKNKNYEDFNKSLEKHVLDMGAAWDEDQKKPEKDRIFTNFSSREEAMESASKKAHDFLVATDPKKAYAWQKDNPNNIALGMAIDRFEIDKKNLTFQEYETIRNRYINRASMAGKTPEEIAYLQTKAKAELDDRLALFRPDLTKKFATENRDIGLAGAHNKLRERDIKEELKNQGRLSKLLGQDPTKKYGDEIVIDEAPENETGQNSAQAQTQASTQQAISEPTTEDLWEGWQETVVPQQPPQQTQNVTLTTAPPQQTPIPASANSSSRAPRRLPIRRSKPSATGEAKKIAKGQAKKGALAFLLSPAGVALVIIVFLIIIVLYALSNTCNFAKGTIFNDWAIDAVGIRGICEQPIEEQIETIPGTTIDLEAVGDASDGSIDNNQNIELRVTVTIDPSVKGAPNPQDLTVYVRPDFNYTLPSVTGTHSTENGQIIWKLFENPQTPSNTYVFNFTLKPGPEEINKSITLTAYVVDKSGKGVSTDDYTIWDNTIPTIDETDIFAGKDEPPSHYTCNGKYTRIMNQLANSYNSIDGNAMETGTGTNFGDPVCSYSDTKLKSVIAEYETRPISQGYQVFWYDIARCESSTNEANEWNKDDNKWGLFQLDRSYQNPGKTYDPQNTEYNRGDLTWQNQIKEAVKRNKEKLNESFDDWDSAKCLCSYAKHKDGDYCKLITNKYSQSEMRNYCTAVCPNY